MAKRDYYTVLGVARDATPDQIRTAYRKLARKYHPDVNKDDPKAEDKFKEVQEAYDCLSDKQKRAAYDQFGFAGPGGGEGGWRPEPGPGGGGGRRSYSGGWPGGGGFEVGDLGDLFEMFGRQGARSAGGRRGRSQPGRQAPRGEDIYHEVQVSFEEAALGTKREIQLVGPGGEQLLSFKIPAGLNDGGRIRLKGKGQPGISGEDGDLYITVHILGHAYFRREGLDVIVDLPLTLGEAALGAKADVPTLKGKVNVTVPPNTSSGARLRLRGLGVRREKDGDQGDQYVVVRIMLPKKLDEPSRQLVRDFEQRNPLDPRKDLGW